MPECPFTVFKSFLNRVILTKMTPRPRTDTTSHGFIICAQISNIPSLL